MDWSSDQRLILEINMGSWVGTDSYCGHHVMLHVQFGLDGRCLPE